MHLYTPELKTSPITRASIFHVGTGERACFCVCRGTWVVGCQQQYGARVHVPWLQGETWGSREGALMDRQICCQHPRPGLGHVESVCEAFLILCEVVSAAREVAQGAAWGWALHKTTGAKVDPLQGQPRIAPKFAQCRL
jgi:hypothetical protein